MTIAPSTQPMPLAAVAARPAPVASVGVAQAAVKPLALTPTGLVIIGLLGAAFVGLFYHFFYVQNFQAMTSQDWSHSYFVPLITLYLLWHKRAELAPLKPTVFWPGVIPIVLGIMCYMLFQMNQALNNHMLRGFSMILCLFGLILLLLGPRIAQVMFLPIAYLVFAVTLAEKIMRELTVPLRFWATEGSYFLLNLVGVDAERRGTILDIQTSTGPVPLNVAEACSGMRMVIAFVALGAAVALVSAKHWWQRVALLLLAVPVAILMNVLRVAVLGLLTLWDPKLAQGESHMIIGYLLLVPAFLLYMGIVWALNKVVVEPPEPKPASTPWWRPERINWRAVTAPAVLVSFGLLTASAVALPAAVKAAGVYLRKLPIHAVDDRQVRNVPRETANWVQVGEDSKESADMLVELGTENTITRAYSRKTPQPGRPPTALALHLAYYTGGVDAVPHIMDRCMVAGGWEIAASGTQVLPLALDQSTWRAHRHPEAAAAGIRTAKLPNQFTDAPGEFVTLPRDADKLSMRITEFFEPKSQHSLFGGYFFIANGGVSDSAEGVRLLAFNLSDDYAFYCKVQVSSESVRSAEELAQQASSLISELLPEIMRCVPDWVEVQRGAYPPGRTDKSKAAGGK